MSNRRNEELRIDRLMGIIEDKITDPRRAGGNLRHKLVEILVIILLGVMSGAETWIEHRRLWEEEGGMAENIFGITERNSKQ